jgi:hypothetical protein
VIGTSLCSMVARPTVIFSDGMKNFLDGGLLAATLRSNLESPGHLVLDLIFQGR